MAHDLKLRIVPRGPGSESLRAMARVVIRHPAVRKFLKRARYRLLSLTLVEPEPAIKPRRVPPTSDRYRATIYDYTRNRTVFVDGRLRDRRRVQISESGLQPRPNRAERDAAVRILLKHSEFGSAIRANRLHAYPAMPPLIEIQSPGGRAERTISVGLLPIEKEVRHEIVGVNLIRRSVIRFDRGAPVMALAERNVCGLPFADQATVKSEAGQVSVAVDDGDTELWKFIVVRPAASSGVDGSGVELRFVDYRGKRVLHRAHVPILNVKYDNDACGPYRDWQNEENRFQAAGLTVVPGLKACPNPATTILDTGVDTGNFHGVAIYKAGQELVLVSELAAGWYRYISEWRLHADGTIRPRFGFSAVQSSCVCVRHHHHVYWRLDFDIRTAFQNRVLEFNPRVQAQGALIHYETMRPRDPSTDRRWRIENTVTGEGYDIIPGPEDGVATASPDWPFPRGDVWILRHHQGELDDGTVAVGAEAGLDAFVNGEPVSNHDVVIWYGAHVTHDPSTEPGTFGHITGPTLKPVNWLRFKLS